MKNELLSFVVFSLPVVKVLKLAILKYFDNEYINLNFYSLHVHGLGIKPSYHQKYIIFSSKISYKQGLLIIII